MARIVVLGAGICGMSAPDGLRAALAKMRSGDTEPIYERHVLRALGIERLK